MNIAKIFGATFACAVLATGASGCAATSEDLEEEIETTSQEITGGACEASTAKGAVPAKHRALLDTIAYTEGTRGRGKDGYNVTFGYKYFSSCVKHPNIKVCSGRLCSTAAGRYQFLYKTWTGLGLSNFTPANQDKGAMKLVGRRGVTVPTNRAMTATEFTNAMNRLSWEWASLPPGRYGQPVYSMSATRKEYCRLAGC